MHACLNEWYTGGMPARQTRGRVAERGRPKMLGWYAALFPRGAHAYGLATNSGAPLCNTGAGLLAL